MVHSYRIGLLGCGEAGQAIAQSLYAVSDQLVVGFDVRAVGKDAALDLSGNIGLQPVSERKHLASDADIIISVVTADDAVLAADQLCPYLSEHHIFIDANSISPNTKKQIAQQVRATGASYVDMAIMAPILPRGHKTPVLIAGPDKARLTPMLDMLGFDYDWRGEAIGEASMVKMLRSVLIKGVESLVCECVTAAQGQGLDTEILTSAGKTLGIEDMPGLADYVMERVARHGRRRAAELREVAKTLDELGLSNYLPTAIAVHQDMVADLNLAEHFSGNIPENRALLATAMREGQHKTG